MPNFLLDSAWPGLAIWAILYTSDYYLTIWCARLRRRGGADMFVHEGSYELTPYFQKDVDTLRLLSPRFLWMLVLYAVLLLIVWRLTIGLDP